MKKRILIAVLIAVLAAFFASRNPDGLDKVSNVLGFAESAKENVAVMKDYEINILGQNKISSAIAGVIGVFVVFGIFEIVYFLLRQKRSIPSQSAMETFRRKIKK